MRAVYNKDGSAVLVEDTPVSLAEAVALIPPLWVGGLPKDYNLVIRRYLDENYCMQVDRYRLLTVLEAAVQRENLVATYKADGYEPVNDLDFVKKGEAGFVRIYISKAID